MDKSFFSKLFSHPQTPDRKTTPAPANYEDADVQFGMGLMFANGKSAAHDYVQAAEWYRKAAAQSHSLAQFNLGMMYANGQGVTQDDAESVAWFGKAAQLGDAGAQFNMGRSCHRACFRRKLDTAKERVDSPESKIEAYKWYRLATTQGYDGADAACETLILNMTREDIAIGDQRVADFEVPLPKPAQA